MVLNKKKNPYKEAQLNIKFGIFLSLRVHILGLDL